MFDSLVNWVAGVDTSNQKAGDAVDAKLLALNQANYEKGLWTKAQLDSANANINANIADNTTSAVAGQIETAAVAGAKQGFTNALNAPADFLSYLVGQFSAKTWTWVLIIVGGYLVITFWPLIKRVVNKIK